MTDTTDTKALREECAQWVKDTIGEAVDTRMALNGDGNDYMSWDMSVIWLAWLHLSGKLEAERQRADEGAKEITYWCNLNARKNERMGELEAAEKERDEITTGILELIPDCRYMDPPDGGSVTPLEQLSRMVTELRAAPQKPVVLLPPAYEKSADFTEYHQGWNACRNYMLAEAKEVGGIVKDGE